MKVFSDSPVTMTSWGLCSSKASLLAVSSMKPSIELNEYLMPLTRLNLHKVTFVLISAPLVMVWHPHLYAMPIPSHAFQKSEYISEWTKKGTSIKRRLRPLLPQRLRAQALQPGCMRRHPIAMVWWCVPVTQVYEILWIPQALKINPSLNLQPGKMKGNAKLRMPVETFKIICLRYVNRYLQM